MHEQETHDSEQDAVRTAHHVEELVLRIHVQEFVIFNGGGEGREGERLRG